MAINIQFRKFDNNGDFIGTEDIRDAFIAPRVGDHLSLDESGEVYLVGRVHLHYGECDAEAENTIVDVRLINTESTSILEVL